MQFVFKKVIIYVKNKLLIPLSCNNSFVSYLDMEIKSKITLEFIEFWDTKASLGLLYHRLRVDAT